MREKTIYFFMSLGGLVIVALVFKLVITLSNTKCRVTWEVCNPATSNICWDVENNCKSSKYVLSMTGNVQSPYVFFIGIKQNGSDRISRFVTLKKEDDAYSGYKCMRYAWIEGTEFSRSEIEESCEQVEEYKKIFQIMKTVNSTPTLDKKHVEVTYEY